MTSLQVARAAKYVVKVKNPCTFRVGPIIGRVPWPAQIGPPPLAGRITAHEICGVEWSYHADDWVHYRLGNPTSNNNVAKLAIARIVPFADPCSSFIPVFLASPLSSLFATYTCPLAYPLPLLLYPPHRNYKVIMVPR